MDITVRPIHEDEITEFRSVVYGTFGFDPEDDDAANERFRATFPLERTVAAFASGRIVGTGAGFPFEVTVPGGSASMSGTTVITVRPTHRRRGVLTAMMRAHLDDTRERGEPLAGLWASEASIYGRFGYGAAADLHDTTIDARTTEFLGDPPPGSLRFVEGDERDKLVPELYEKVRLGRPAMLSRSPAWWKHRLFYDPERWRNGASSQRWVGYFDDTGAAAGYVTFRQKEKFEEGHFDSTLSVVELIASTDDAHSALWRFVLSVDLFPNVSYWNVAVDDPLPWKLTNRRAVRRKRSETLWVRVLDVPAALTARRYGAEGRLVLGIADAFCGDVAGNYELVVGSDGAECHATDAASDLDLDVGDLGSIYLGGHAPSTLSRAGRIRGSAEALETADALFRWGVAPWCPEVF
jgi:predicted acetyltransferase